ncbi:MAG: phosphoribosylanthranilate isomerase [Pseudomonadota bacterium]
MSGQTAHPVRVKICGLTSIEAAQQAADAGADYLGLNLFAPSARSVPVDTARQIAEAVSGVTHVALMVNPDDALVDAASFADLLQLHGAETPERVAEIRARTGRPVMKVFGVRSAADLASIAGYTGVTDQLMVDAKPPEGDKIPGGHGVPFDWRLIARRDWPLPWMLAGGLTPDNVAEAIRLTGATQVDVASGVEESPGIKDAVKVRDFITAATHGRIS